jgi:P-type Mg2+ transporter
MPSLDLEAASALDADEVLRRLRSSPSGLSGGEARTRLRLAGPNEIERRRSNAIGVLARQFASPFLILLIATALLSLVLHDRSDALIILAIVVLSIGLSFINEFGSEKAVADLRARIQRRAIVVRDGQHASVPVTELVPGDVVHLRQATSPQPTCG